MATGKNGSGVSGRGINFRSSPSSDTGSVVPNVRNPSESGSVTFAVVLLILFLLLLPLLVMIYFDTLKAQHRVERSVERMEKLIKQIEKEKEKQ
jgi:hypothetical protein